jgi:hypothetical protein
MWIPKIALYDLFEDIKDPMFQVDQLYILSLSLPVGDGR